MKRGLAFIAKFPEYFLMFAVAFYWFSSALVFNPVAITLMSLLVLQLFLKSRLIGLFISGVLTFGSCLMLLALISEFREFPSFSSGAQELLFVGLSLFLGTLFIAGLLLFKSLGIQIFQIKQKV